MFILRRITSENLVSNEFLGDHYNYVNKELNPNDFKECMNKMKWDESDPDIYGFIVHEHGSKMFALYKKSAYFVMCSDGKTFENITFKK